MQRCPVLPNAPCTIPAAARSRSASGITTTAFFPPISHVTLASRPAARAYTPPPISHDPGERDGADLRIGDERVPDLARRTPTTSVRTPSGRPASARIATYCSATSGVSDAGFSSTAFPATSAGATFHAGSAQGKFQGVMTATTPSGCRIVHRRVVGISDGRVLPPRRNPSPEYHSSRLMPFSTSPRASPSTLPSSRVSSRASASSRDRAISAARASTRPRSGGGVARHPG